MLSYKTCAVGMYQYSIHAPRNEYLVTHAFEWLDKRLNEDVRDKIKALAGRVFVVNMKFQYPLSREVRKFPLDFPDDVYNPMLHIVRTFEFKRPIIGATDSLVNLGLVHFKYSQRAEPEPRPPSVKDDYMTPEYVDKVCAGMKRDLEFDNITKIRLLLDGEFEFVRKGADGQDEILKDLNIHWNLYYRGHYAHKFKDELKLKHAPGDPYARVRSDRTNEYYV